MPWRRGSCPAILALLFVAAAGCKEKPIKPAAAEDAAPTVIDAAPRIIDAAAKPVVETFDSGGDESKALARVSAIPLWSAVVERGRLLARRGQSGAVYGRVVEHEGARYLADETTGGGALAAELMVPEGMELAAGTRVVAWGAWVAPRPGVWAWRAHRVARLGDDGLELTEPPGLDIRANQPPRLTPLTELINKGLVKPEDVVGLAFSFYVRWKPDKQGDRWGIGDSARGKILAEVSLPGDRESYGGQDYRSQNERWQLSRDVVYWGRVASFRPPRKDDEVPRIVFSAPPYKLP